LGLILMCRDNDNRNEEQDEAAGRGKGGFVAGFLLGAVVGGVAAVLLTQEDTRDVLAGKAREAGNYAKDTGDDFRGKVGDMTSGWQSSASDLYERGRAVVENARATINAAIEEGANNAEQTRDELQRKAAEQQEER
jgi:gas vesicle protein